MGNKGLKRSYRKFSLTPNRGILHAVPTDNVASEISSLLYEHMQIYPEMLTMFLHFPGIVGGGGAEQMFSTYFYVHCDLLSFLIFHITIRPLKYKGSH
jgi:hypothetical protein